jgi:hypothetical protein
MSVLLLGCGDAGERGKPGSGSVKPRDRSLQSLDAQAGKSSRDVNGDGLDDFVVRARKDPEIRMRAVVVFGSRERRPVDALNLGDQGLSITLAGSAEDEESAEARIVGDIDGDGFADIALTGFAGQGFIVFGRPSGGSLQIDVRQPRSQDVMEVRGISGNGDQIGLMGPAGDVDADGYDDVLVPGPARQRRVISVLRGGPRLPFVHVLKPSSRVVPIRGTRRWQNLAVGIGNHGGDQRADLAVVAQMRGRTVEMGVWIVLGRRGARSYQLLAGRRAREVHVGSHRAGYYVPQCGRSGAAVPTCPDPDSYTTSFGLIAPERIGDIDRDGFDDFAIERLDLRQRRVSQILFGGRIASQFRTRTLPFHWARAVGDTDGDGTSELAAFRRGHQAPEIFYLDRSARVVARTSLRGFEVYGVSPIGDADGDGFGDLLVVGDRRATLLYGAADRSAVYVWRPSQRAVPITGLFL